MSPVAHLGMRGVGGGGGGGGVFPAASSLGLKLFCRVSCLEAALCLCVCFGEWSAGL